MFQLPTILRLGRGVPLILPPSSISVRQFHQFPRFQFPLNTKGTLVSPDKVATGSSPSETKPVVDPAAASSSKSEVSSNTSGSSPENKFLVIPGNLTGDRWHVAAALLLDRKLPPEKRGRSWIPQPAVLYSNRYVSGAKDSFDMFTALGFKPVVVAGLDESKDTNNAALPRACVNQKFLDQETANTWDEAKAIEDRIAGSPLRTLMQSDDDDLIPLHCSTTLLMQLVAKFYPKDHKDANVARRILADAVKEIVQSKYPHLIDIAERRVVNFEKFVTAVKEKKKDCKEILLFNYRKGDVNKQHDSTPNLLEQVRVLASKRHVAVAAIALTNPAQYTELDEIRKGGAIFVFDMFEEHPELNIQDLPNSTTKNSSSLPEESGPSSSDASKPVPPTLSFVENTLLKAYTWRLFAEKFQIPDITGSSSSDEIPAKPEANSKAKGKGKAPVSERPLLGLIGGRSGSMDLPSFMGINCLSWDEPCFSDAQVIRLLNQKSWMSICYLQPPESGAGKGRAAIKNGGNDITNAHDLKLIEDHLITDWLDKKYSSLKADRVKEFFLPQNYENYKSFYRGPHSTGPGFKEWIETGIEKREIGIQAVNLLPEITELDKTTPRRSEPASKSAPAKR